MTEPNSVKAVLEQLAEVERQRAEPNLTSKQRRARIRAGMPGVVHRILTMRLMGRPHGHHG